MGIRADARSYPAGDATGGGARGTGILPSGLAGGVPAPRVMGLAVRNASRMPPGMRPRGKTV
ncbi:MAG TPA: hypothetical protein PLC79_01525, partial [Phycisphaerae bacterium]|nr:hypothetical protein [Phycisphaerae bacterium]